MQKGRYYFASQDFRTTSFVDTRALSGGWSGSVILLIRGFTEIFATLLLDSKLFIGGTLTIS